MMFMWRVHKPDDSRYGDPIWKLNTHEFLSKSVGTGEVRFFASVRVGKHFSPRFLSRSPALCTATTAAPDIEGA